ncbi:malate synthase A [bacterium]|nr:malate synthase A [bacterium]
MRIERKEERILITVSYKSLEIRGIPLEYGYLFRDRFLEFFHGLCERFFVERLNLLNLRQKRQKEIDAGATPRFCPETKTIRESGWIVEPIPNDLLDRRVEITGPPDRKMIINALNSGANCFMADFEDSMSPTWNNVLSGHDNLYDAVRRNIDFTSPEGKRYTLNEKTAVLICRPRGLHLEESHSTFGGEPVPAAFFDFALYFYHNAASLLRSGTSPYFYLPKLQSHEEARLWAAIFSYAEDYFYLPRGMIKATVLIETIHAAFEMHEILWELRYHAAGLNCGRWDYIFSFIKTFRNRGPAFVLPDRGEITMDKGFLRAYSELLIQTCNRRGALALGGLAAQNPIKHDPKANEEALAKVRADKEREARAGHDGTWVAHPGLVTLAREVFDEYMHGPNQLHIFRGDIAVTEKDLLAVPKGLETIEGLRKNIAVSLRYLTAWLQGNGCVPVSNLMEDAATVEISRAQIWQWIRNHAILQNERGDKIPLTKKMFLHILRDIYSKLFLENKSQSYRNALETAKTLFESMCTSKEFDEFFTLRAYRYLD